MRRNNEKIAFGLILVILVIICTFSYDLGVSSNTIRNGQGNGLIGISAASGLFTVLMALNLSIIIRNEKRQTGTAKKRKHN